MPDRKRELYENLYEYRLAKKFADRIWAVVEHWEPFAKREIGDHLIGASDTLQSNVERALTGADAGGRGGEFARKARSSLFECRHWMKKAFKEGLLSEDEADELLIMVESLGPRIDRIIDLLNTQKPGRA